MSLTGRPTSYKPEYDRMAFRHTLLGATDEQLADLFDVAVATIYNWKNEHPSFLEAVKAGKDDADAVVLESLYKRATGFTNDKATKIFMPAGASEPVYAPYEEYFAPDPTSMIFWLKNRRPKQWRDRPEAEDQNKQVIEKLDEVLDKIDGAV